MIKSEKSSYGATAQLSSDGLRQSQVPSRSLWQIESRIQELTADATWQYVPSEENPADFLSRGTTVDILKRNSLWWHGPCWLKEKKQRPKQMTEPEENLPELRATAVTLVSAWTSGMLRRYSSYAKLCRVIAYARRFRLAFTDLKKIGLLEAEELKEAEETHYKMGSTRRIFIGAPLFEEKTQVTTEESIMFINAIPRF